MRRLRLLGELHPGLTMLSSRVDYAIVIVCNIVTTTITRDVVLSKNMGGATAPPAPLLLTPVCQLTTVQTKHQLYKVHMYEGGREGIAQQTNTQHYLQSTQHLLRSLQTKYQILPPTYNIKALGMSACVIMAATQKGPHTYILFTSF